MADDTDEMVPTFEEDFAEVASETTEVSEQPKVESADAATEEAAEPEAKSEAEPESEVGIDWAKVKAEDIPQDLVQRHPAFRGVLYDLQETRRRREDQPPAKPEAKAEESEDQDPLADLDDDDVPTVAQIRERERWQVRQSEKAAKARQAEEAERQAELAKERRERQFADLKTRVDKDAPEKLDASSVIGEGAKWLKANKPHLFRAAWEAEDVAEEMYELCLAHVPSIRQRMDAARAAGLVDKIKGAKPRGASPSPKGGTEAWVKVMQSGDTDAIERILAEDLENEN